MSSLEKKKNTNFKIWLFASFCFLCLIIGIVSFVSSRSSFNEVQTYNETYTDLGFDTPVSFQATCSKEDFEKYETILRDTFLAYNALFDQYNTYDGVQNVKVLNETAYLNPTQVDTALVDCLQIAIKAGELDARFDVSEGKVLKVWHDAREAEEPYVPSDQVIQEAKEHEGISAIKIEGDTIEFTDPNLQLDLGGIAKGYTAGVAAKRLKEAGLDNGYINAGGNVVLLGEKVDGKDWVIGIQSPDSSKSVVQFTTHKPVTMVTSGDYQRYMEVDGKKYAHIIDPTTGYPAEYMRSVTVIEDADQSAWADAMSTTLFCMPVSEGLQFCKDNDLQAVWITDRDKPAQGADPVFETADYMIYCTEGLKDSLNLTK